MYLCIYTITILYYYKPQCSLYLWYFYLIKNQSLLWVLLGKKIKIKGPTEGMGSVRKLIAL